MFFRDELEGFAWKEVLLLFCCGVFAVIFYMVGTSVVFLMQVFSSASMMFLVEFVCEVLKSDREERLLWRKHITYLKDRDGYIPPDLRVFPQSENFYR